MARRPETIAKINSQVDGLCRNFDDYLAEFKGSQMNSEKYMSWHKKTIDLRKDLGGTANSIDSDEYMRSLYDTLDAWGMNSQGAEMKEYPEFVKSVRKYRDDIALLDEVRVAQIDANITWRLWRIIWGMWLSQTGSPTVTGAKALHHLLPRLLPPIDRRYTRRFFRYSGQPFQDKQEEAFRLMLPYFARIAQRVDLRRYVGPESWATSESKMIDNAIIGYCIRHTKRLPQ